MGSDSDSVVIIQRAFRKWFYRDAICCITHEKLNYPCFIYKSCGVCIFYDYLALNNYFNYSGNLVDPKTRNKYTQSEYSRFKKELKQHFPNEINHIPVEISDFGGIMLYTFSLIPEQHQPSGTINFRSLGFDEINFQLIDNQRLNFTI